MTCKLLVLPVFCLLLFTVSTGIAHASIVQKHYPIGTIAALQGDAWYATHDKKTPLKEDDPVYFNSIIQTGKDSRALILFIDDTQITLGDNSELVIDEYTYDPYDDQENKGAFSFGKGTFLWISGMIAKKDDPDIRLNTEYGSIGIRGTTVWGGHLSEEKYGVYVDKGQVHFEGEWGSGELSANEGIFVNKNKILQDVIVWDPAIVEKSFDAVAFRKIATEKMKEHIEELTVESIRKRNDYRGRMYPYKESPFHDTFKPDDDNFFSNQFEEMRNRIK